MKAVLLALALLTLSGCSIYTSSTTRPVVVDVSVGVGFEHYHHHHRPPVIIVPPHHHGHHGHGHHDHRGHHYHR